MQQRLVAPAQQRLVAPAQQRLVPPAQDLPQLRDDPCKEQIVLQVCEIFFLSRVK